LTDPLDKICDECGGVDLEHMDIELDIKWLQGIGIERVRIHSGDNNQIRIVEEVWAINDVTMVLDVTLTDEDQGRWLKHELHTRNMKNWVDENTFGDRKAINERYGIT